MKKYKQYVAEVAERRAFEKITNAAIAEKNPLRIELVTIQGTHAAGTLSFSAPGTTFLIMVARGSMTYPFIKFKNLSSGVGMFNHSKLFLTDSIFY